MKIICHSYGSLIAINLVNLLEQEGHRGKVVFVDGSPDVLIELGKNIFTSSKVTLEDEILRGTYGHIAPNKLLNSATVSIPQLE